MKLTLEPLTESKLDAFRSLLGSDEFGGCFCAVWTSHDDTWVKRCGDKAQPNFFITKQNVEQGRHVGYLVYQDSELVGWTVSVEAPVSKGTGSTGLPVPGGQPTPV